MKVILRYPKREVEVAGPRRVKELLKEFDVLPETVLVIRGSELLTGDTVVGGDDVIELRPVISGGAGGRRPGDRGAADDRAAERPAADRAPSPGSRR